MEWSGGVEWSGVERRGVEWSLGGEWSGVELLEWNLVEWLSPVLAIELKRDLVEFTTAEGVGGPTVIRGSRFALQLFKFCIDLGMTT